MATTFAVPDGRVAMAATTYTGTGATLAVSNAVNSVGMQPDLVWIKNRSGVNSHQLVDSIRGVTKYLFSDATAADDTRTDQVTAFSTSGFSLSALVVNTAVNNTGNNYVGWQWKAGGTAVSNTAGTITSSVSANTTAGFSVVTYTGTGANATVGHGLGVAPAFIITKARSAVQSWYVYHSATGGTKTLYLNLTDAAGVDNRIWNNTDPTTSVFSIGTVGPNASGVTQVAYCWAPVAGYSAFGSYTGNGSTDGPFIYTGFRPRYILIKSSGSAQGWVLQDSSRQPYNYTLRNALFANDSMAELNDAYPTDFLSNGFKIRNAGDGVNTSAITYIYAAFAENPLKYANAR
jgi:hypothetical protein